MSIYKDNCNKVNDIYINVNGKKKVNSCWINRNGVATKVFSNNNNIVNGVKIVSWTDGTYEEIADMLDAHYSGKINISDYWHVGDERIVHLSAMTSDYTDFETQPEQDATIVILDFEKDSFKTPINEHTKAAITVQLKEPLANRGIIDASYRDSIANFDTVILRWGECDRRKWCNNTFKNSLPSQLRTLIKYVEKTNPSLYVIDKSDSDGNKYYIVSSNGIFSSVHVYDYCFLLTRYEIYGAQIPSYSNPCSDPIAYNYFDNNLSSQICFLRSPSFYNMGDTEKGIQWDTTKSGIDFEITCGLAPAFCL